jgi:cytoskeletal protein CcmA (bactofilin family)
MAWIKQRTENDPAPAAAPTSAAPEAPRHSAPTQPIRETRSSVDRPVNIGKSVEIKGDLTGNEDLTIEGKLDGKVILKGHQLTIGANGQIRGEIRAKSVVVVGQLTGNIVADDRVEIAASGSMNGDIRAPRVVLVDGASFKGSVDMEKRAAQTTAQASTQTAAPSATQPIQSTNLQQQSQKKAERQERELAVASK